MIASLFNTLVSCSKIPELRSRIIFTLLLLAVCRLMSVITVPGLDGAALAQYFQKMSQREGGGVLGMYSMFTGGALEHCAIAALGIMPYISATIIVQLLTAVVPQLSKLAREEGGRPKLVQYGRYLTLVLCIGQGFVMALGWENAGKLFQGFDGNLVMYSNLWWYRIQTTVVLTAGTLFLMWLGEQITERGIGNGVSLIITVGILARLPAAVRGLYDVFVSGATGEAKMNLGHALVLVALLLAVVATVVAITQAQRKIPVQYAQRAVGRRVYGGGVSFLPLRVNYAGVMPIIFAGAILMFPSMICQTIYSKTQIGLFRDLYAVLQERTVWYNIMYGLMIMFFSYFWVATQFNELQIADDLKKNGGYIPGVRPGQATSTYLHNSMHRITLAGACFLTVIAIIPNFLYRTLEIPYAVAQFFGGTSLLITVGVLLDTMRQMESHLLMRHYDGFLKRGRIKGRV